MATHAVMVRAEGAPPAPWESGAGGGAAVMLGGRPTGETRDALQTAGCALIDGAQPDPVGWARLVRSVDPALQVVIVADAAEQPRIRKSMLFTPGLGEVWLVAPAEVTSELVERAGTVTRQRRAYRDTHVRIEHDLAGIEPHAARRAFVSDAFLAALLGALPDPVASIDEEGQILSWSPAAEAVLGYSRDEAIGRPLSEVLAPADPDRLRAVLTAPGNGSRSEITLRARDGAEMIAEVAAVAVEAAGHRVRAVILHDVTEERRIQAEREAHAAEVEMQAEELQSQAAQLEETQLELEMANQGLKHANAQLADRTAEAERERAAAEAANRAKSDFLATMSHELRTPINAIIGYTDLLEVGVAGPLTEGQRTQLERVRASSRHLLMLIEDILDLAKVESGRLEVALERIPVAEPVLTAISLVEPQAAEKEIQLVNSCGEGGAPFVVGDEDRVRQILVNLLSNAVKFTDAEGAVHVSCGTAAQRGGDPDPEQGGAWTFIEVRDTGIGVEPEELEGIFRPFVQAEAGLTRTKGGTGLGLSISRELARLMEGDLTASSEPGVGSCFTLWLPNEASSAAPLDEAVLRETRQEGRAVGLAAAGECIRASIDSILGGFVDRLAADPLIPMAHALGRGDLEDHASTLLADIAQALIVLEKSEHDLGELLRDGTQIQIVISELHGAQRERLGWTEEALRREFVLLRDEMEAVLRERGGEVEEDALEILRRYLRHAEHVSLRSLLRGMDRS